MSKYINYKRINGIFNSDQIQNKFDSLVKEGFDIIYYDESILEKTPEERIIVTMVIGKINKGLKLLNS